MNKRKLVHIWIYYSLFISLAFLIPIHNRLASWVIAFIFLNWFLELRFITHFRSIFGNPERWKLLAFSLLYLFYLAGMLWSANKEYGTFDLQVKLSLALFPVFFATMDPGVIEPWRVKHYFIAFISGCLAASAWCVAFAFRRYTETLDPSEFFYGKFSLLLHTSYFSMFVNFAIIILLLFMYRSLLDSPWYVKGGIISLILFFQLVIVLLSSKTGILTLFITYILILFWLLRKRNFVVLKYPVALLAALLLFLFLSPATFDRFRSSGKAIAGLTKVSRDASEATAARILIWQSSYEIIRDDPWIGAGTGDVKDQLLSKYRKEGISSALEHRLNAHNQYLQTWMTLGFFGLLLLAGLFLYPAIRAFRKGDNLYFLFLTVFAVNMLTESMFETQSGVVFFAFFNALLFRIRASSAS